MAEQSSPAALPCAGAQEAGPEAVPPGEHRETVRCRASGRASGAPEAARLADEATTPENRRRRRVPSAERRRGTPTWAAVCVLAVITGLALAGVLTTTGGWTGPGSGDSGQAGSEDEAGAARPKSPAALAPPPSSPTGLAGTASERRLGPGGQTPEPSASATAAPAPGKPRRTAGASASANDGTRRAEPHGRGTAGPGTASGGTPGAYCTAHYTVVSRWRGGFEADVALTAREPLNGWRIRWTFPDGQYVTAMWHGFYRQVGGTVTVTAASYDRSVAAGRSFGVGFLGFRGVRNTAPEAFVLNGHRCRR